VNPPEKKSEDFRYRPTGHRWSGIVVHHTGLGANKPQAQSPKFWKKLFTAVVSWLTKKDTVYVSSHFVIGREGELAMLVDPETGIAWHAGRSRWWNPLTRKMQKSCNNYMIGIELVGDGNSLSFSDEQYKELAILSRSLMDAYSILPIGIVGHEMVSPGRKVDPGKFFDWKRFFEDLHFHKERRYE